MELDFLAAEYPDGTRGTGGGLPANFGPAVPLVVADGRVFLTSKPAAAFARGLLIVAVATLVVEMVDAMLVLRLAFGLMSGSVLSGRSAIVRRRSAVDTDR